MAATTAHAPHNTQPRKREPTKRAKNIRIADIADPALRARLYGLSEKMLDKIERTLDVIAPPPLDDPRAPPVPPSILRWTSDMMALWRVCPHEACRRARCCRRKPAACVMRGTDQVPPDVRKGVAALLRGRRQGLAYEEVRAAAREDILAVEIWLDEALRSATPKRHTRGAALTARSGSGTVWCARAAGERRIRPAY